MLRLTVGLEFLFSVVEKVENIAFSGVVIFELDSLTGQFSLSFL